MSRDPLPDLRREPEAFIASVDRRLAAGQGVRRAVPGGWLHMDRPLPFLCVYRHPPQGAIDGAERLVLSQASHLSVSEEPELTPVVTALVAALGSRLSGRFGSFLVIGVAGPRRRRLSCPRPPDRTGQHGGSPGRRPEARGCAGKSRAGRDRR